MFENAHMIASTEARCSRLDGTELCFKAHAWRERRKEVWFGKLKMGKILHNQLFCQNRANMESLLVLGPG